MPLPLRHRPHVRTTGRWPIRFGRIFGCRYFPERDFILTDFLRDGDKDASAAIARAIQACHNAGGGWVVVPAGEFRCGPVHLRYGVNFHLSAGALLAVESCVV